jgi:hypothetical protein
VGELKKKISAKSPGAPKPGKPKPKVPHNGLYMVFPEDFGFARLQRGTGTEVDILPAQVTLLPLTVRYALAVGQKWVLFDTKKKQAVLVDKVRDEGLFKRHEHPKYPAITKMVLSGDSLQLKMDGSKFKEWDDDDVLRSGVDMVTYPGNDQVSILSCTKPTLTSPSAVYLLLIRVRWRNPVKIVSLHCLGRTSKQGDDVEGCWRARRARMAFCTVNTYVCHGMNLVPLRKAANRLVQ